MNRTSSAVTLFVLAAGLALPSLAAAQTIVQGPVFNPATGSRYYVINNSPNWQASRNLALSMGGDLATINDAAENEFIRANLANVGSGRKLFLGLSRPNAAAPFAWSSGSNASYRNWGAGEPNNGQSSNFAQIRTDGTWAAVENNFTAEAVIEIAGSIRVPGEFPTIAAAVAAFNAAGSREIFLAPGSYPVDATINVSAMVLQSAGGRGQAIIQTPTSGPAFNLSGASRFESISFQGRGNAALLSMTSGATLVGFGLDLRALQTSTAPHVTVNGSDFRIDYGSARFGGPVVSGTGAPSTVFLRSTLITDTASVFGPSINGNVLGCTVSRVGPGELFAAPAAGTHNIIGSIFWNNTGTITPARIGAIFSNFQTPIPTFGNVSANPLFTDAANNDFTLSPFSPMIDRSSTQVITSWANAPRQFTDSAGNFRIYDDRSVSNNAEGGPLDIGAFERQSDSCPADFNGDGTADFFDYLDFVQAFSEGC
jgi:hypothetical protein